MGCVSVSGIEVFKQSFGSVLVECLRAPTDANGYEQAFDVLGKLLAAHADELAAVIVEPIVQGSLGMRMYRPELLRALRELTQKHDIFLICDEVFTGYGRTGPFWASEHAGITADILCTAKGFTAGMMPMSATLMTQRLFDGFLGDGERAFYYGHTFCGNPLGAALAREVLRVYTDERVLELAAGKAARIAAAFEGFRSLPGVVETRSLGMIGALDLAGSKHYLEPRGKLVSAQAKQRGAYLRPLGNTIYIAPSLNIPDAELDELLGIVEESVRAA
jgi:adenosylmethionine-8-amino-7-oxononanoate aminotransferase